MELDSLDKIIISTHHCCKQFSYLLHNHVFTLRSGETWCGLLSTALWEIITLNIKDEVEIHCIYLYNVLFLSVHYISFSWCFYPKRLTTVRTSLCWNIHNRKHPFIVSFFFSLDEALQHLMSSASTVAAATWWRSAASGWSTWGRPASASSAQHFMFSSLN